MNRVADILNDKGRNVLQIEAGATVFDAIRCMVDANVGALLVSDGDETVGIVTERDYLRRVTLEGRTEKEALVREIMSSPVICVTTDTTVEECMALMTERRIRHAPVLDEGTVVGVLSIGDLVKFQSKQQSYQIKYLTDYITAR